MHTTRLSMLNGDICGAPVEPMIEGVSDRAELASCFSRNIANISQTLTVQIKLNIRRSGMMVVVYVKEI